MDKKQGVVLQKNIGIITSNWIENLCVIKLKSVQQIRPPSLQHSTIVLYQFKTNDWNNITDNDHRPGSIFKKEYTNTF